MPRVNSSSTVIPDGYVIGSVAMRMLGLSRHNFDKAIEKGFISKFEDESIGKSLYRTTEIDSFMTSPEYKDMVEGRVDPRNPLNDLTGKEWIPETKSYMYQHGLGASHPHAKIEQQHPAPYSFQDIQKLIELFSKTGMTVLDPFGGVGSTAKAFELSGRHCISIELSPKYHELSIRRIKEEVGEGRDANHQFINANSCTFLPSIQDDSVDFIVTSPPYWGILNKQDQKVGHMQICVSKKILTEYQRHPVEEKFDV